MTHNEFITDIETMGRLITELLRAEKASYYNVDYDAALEVDKALASLKTAIKRQQCSEYYDPMANYS